MGAELCFGGVHVILYVNAGSVSYKGDCFVTIVLLVRTSGLKDPRSDSPFDP
jgi:hypothetical protein